MDENKNFTSGLNEEQIRAVQSTEGPLLILAGAGSGKTKTLTHRIAHILTQRLAYPNQILAVTFTNKAALEMRERVAELLSQNANNRSFMPYLGTFHGICVKLLRQDGEAVGIANNFVIYDESDRQTLIKQLLQKERIDEKQNPARTVASLISNAKNELVSPAELAGLASGPVQKTAAKIYPLYEQELRKAGALDFDDLIGKTVEMLEYHDEVRQKWQTNFKYILIDEYQDTNAAQYKLVKLLVNANRNLCVVGDDWQSIYSWRGADYRNILNFERDYRDVTIVKLEQNYRSTESILEAAHKIISKNNQRSDKKLWTSIGSGSPVQVMQAANERNEAELIIQRIRMQVDIRARKFHDFAILYRTNAQSRAIEEQFVRFGIPYRIFGGVRFYDRKEIKDIIAYLRLIYQPEDRASFERIINVPARSLGATSISRFTSWREINGFGLYEALERVNECIGLQPKAVNAFTSFKNLLEDFRVQSEILAVADLIDGIIRRINYFDYISDGTVQGESRIENVRELLSVAKGYADLGVSGFLEEVSLVSDVDNSDGDGDAVSLMTLHSAKGLEYPVVFMIGMEEGVFPHSRAAFDQSDMEEERRLAYVGMTRAKEELFLTYATSRAIFGNVQNNPPSQFLTDIDAKVGSISDSLINVMPSRSNNDTSNEQKYVPELAEGDGVRHSVFGVGTVMEVDGDVVAIYFKQKGVKKLNVLFAPLEKISEEY